MINNSEGAITVPVSAALWITPELQTLTKVAYRVQPY
jgi:hypothetical protein